MRNAVCRQTLRGTKGGARDATSRWLGMSRASFGNNFRAAAWQGAPEEPPATPVQRVVHDVGEVLHEHEASSRLACARTPHSRRPATFSSRVLGRRDDADPRASEHGVVAGGSMVATKGIPTTTPAPTQTRSARLRSVLFPDPAWIHEGRGNPLESSIRPRGPCTSPAR